MNWKLVVLASAALATSSLVVSAFAPQATGHRELVMKFIDEVWNKGNLAYIDQAVDSNVVRFGYVAEGNAEGIKAYKDRVAQLRSAFTDYNVTLVDMMGVGNKATFTWRLRGNYVGADKSISPGRTVDLVGKTVWLMDGNKVVKEVVHIDPEEYYRQIQLAVPYSEVENRALVLSYLYEVMSQGNMNALTQLVAPNHVLHDVYDVTVTGVDALRKHVLAMRTAFPDLTVKIHEIIADGNIVSARWTLSGTNSGEWQGNPPTGLHVDASGLSLAYIKDGKIHETWSEWDTLALRGASSN